MADWRTSNYLIYSFIPELDVYHVIHSFTGAVDRVTPSVVNYLLAQKTPEHIWRTKDEVVAKDSLRGRTLVEIGAEALATLKERGFLTQRTPSEEKEYVRRIAHFLHTRAVDRNRPSFLVVPTYQCNLRCPYCFETDTRIGLSKIGNLDQVLSKGQIDEIYHSIEIETELWRTRVGKDAEGQDGSSHITLYGGEPLSEQTLPAVEYLIHKGAEKGFRFSAITNAVDLHHYTHLLGKGGVDWMQISLDGPQDVHDRSRIGPGHRETYEIILRNIALALDHGVTVSVRYHVNWKTVDRTDEVFADLERLGIRGRKGFSLYIQPTHDYHHGNQTPNHPHMRLHEIQDKLQSQHKLVQYAPVTQNDERIPSKIDAYLETGLAGLAPQAEYCGATTGMSIFDCFNKVYACWDHVGIAGQEIGSYSSKGISFNNQASYWRERSPATIPECTDCKYVFFHFGGCSQIPVAGGLGINSPGCYDFESEFLAFARKHFASKAAAEDLQSFTPNIQTAPPLVQIRANAQTTALIQV